MQAHGAKTYRVKTLHKYKCRQVYFARLSFLWLYSYRYIFRGIMNSEPSSISPMQIGDKSADGEPSKCFVTTENSKSSVSLAKKLNNITIDNLKPEYFSEIKEMSKAVYPFAEPWEPEYLEQHLKNFPFGQLVALSGNRVVGMASSLIIHDSDYDKGASWEEITNNGLLNKHNPKGETLYAAEVISHPEHRNKGIGKSLYIARDCLCYVLGLDNIRATARLSGYSKHSNLDPNKYLELVINGKIWDPTLSFQIKRGFVVEKLVRDFEDDSETLGYAAIIRKPKISRGNFLENVIRNRKYNFKFLAGCP